MKNLLLSVIFFGVAGCFNSQPSTKDQPAVKSQPLTKIIASSKSRCLPTHGNQAINSFSAAKRKLPHIFSKLGQKTIYCDCSYEGKKLTAKSCGYQPKKALTSKGKINLRARRIEWEHIVPAHNFGHNLSSWASHQTFAECQDSKGKSIGARNCSRKTNQQFRYMEADLYNLFPAIGELNGYRSNYSMAEISGEDRNFGACDFEVKQGKVEPRPAVRGLIARIYFYMDWAYPNRQILDSQKGKRQMLESWNEKYPVTDWERQWAKQIHKQQGNCNPFAGVCKEFLAQGSRAIPSTGH